MAGRVFRPAVFVGNLLILSNSVPHLYKLYREKGGIMQYQVMMLNVQKELCHALKHRFSKMDVNLTMAFTMHDAVRLYAEQTFHLLILQFYDFTLCNDFFVALRHINFAPAIALIDKYDPENACNVLKAGADLCIDAKWPVNLSVDHIMAQFRRYTSYNHSETRQGRDTVPFQRGDIYIDPLRRVVRVKEQDIKLQRREFLLLLYFMKNPEIILTAEEICDNAWGIEGSYANGVSGPIAKLRKAIEPDMANPVYIKTEKTAGYYFTAYNSETCDICSDSVGML